MSSLIKIVVLLVICVVVFSSTELTTNKGGLLSETTDTSPALKNQNQDILDFLLLQIKRTADDSEVCMKNKLCRLGISIHRVRLSWWSFNAKVQESDNIAQIVKTNFETSLGSYFEMGSGGQAMALSSCNKLYPCNLANPKSSTIARTKQPDYVEYSAAIDIAARSDSINPTKPVMDFLNDYMPNSINCLTKSLFCNIGLALLATEGLDTSLIQRKVMELTTDEDLQKIMLNSATNKPPCDQPISAGLPRTCKNCYRCELVLKKPQEPSRILTKKRDIQSNWATECNERSPPIRLFPFCVCPLSGSATTSDQQCVAASNRPLIFDF